MASSMLRTQITAYYMFARHYNKPIHIVPHVGERGISIDNIAFPKSKQRDILDAFNHKILELLDMGIDCRGQETIFNKSSMNDFISWAKRNIKYFIRGPDGVFRAIIFTHSHFLKSAFPLKNAVNQIKEGKILGNNDFVFTRIEEEGVQTNTIRYPQFIFVDNSEYAKAHMDKICPDHACRNPVPKE